MSDKDTLGAHLRRGRERSGLTVDAVSAGSRIVPRLVEALESDRLDLLPAPVYVRGFIRAYCEQIGADTAEALRLHDEQAAPDPPLTVLDPPPPAARRWGRVAAMSALAGAVGVAGFVLLGRRPPDAGASRRASGTMTASRSSPAPPPAERATPAPPATNGPAVVDCVLVMRAIDTTWVRVQPEGAAPSEETLSPGSVREWRSPGRFHVTVGSAGRVELELDGRALPALGVPGQVVRDATVPGETPP